RFSILLDERLQLLSRVCRRSATLISVRHLGVIDVCPDPVLSNGNRVVRKPFGVERRRIGIAVSLTARIISFDNSLMKGWIRLRVAAQDSRHPHPPSKRVANEVP